MKKLFTLFALTFLTFSATAREVVVDLPINGEYYNSKTFKIKRLIKQQRPNLNLERARLDRVILRFKSKRSSDVTLTVGQDHQSEFIRGLRRAYDRRGGAERLEFFAPRNRQEQKGRWQLHVDSDFEYKIKKARAVVVVKDRVRPRPPRPAPGRHVQTCGYVRETVWGTDLEKYYRDGRGDTQAEALDRACQQAKQACKGDMSSFLEKCKRL